MSIAPADTPLGSTGSGSVTSAPETGSIGSGGSVDGSSAMLTLPESVVANNLADAPNTAPLLVPTASPLPVEPSASPSLLLETNSPLQSSTHAAPNADPIPALMLSISSPENAGAGGGLGTGQSVVAPISGPHTFPSTLQSQLTLPGGSVAAAAAAATSRAARTRHSTVGRFEVLEQESSPAASRTPGRPHTSDSGYSPQSALSPGFSPLPLGASATSPGTQTYGNSGATSPPQSNSDHLSIDAVRAGTDGNASLTQSLLSSISEESTPCVSDFGSSPPQSAEFRTMPDPTLKSQAARQISATLSPQPEDDDASSSSSSSESESDSDDENERQKRNAANAAAAAAAAAASRPPLDLPTSPPPSANSGGPRTTRSGRFSVTDFASQSPPPVGQAAPAVSSLLQSASAAGQSSPQPNGLSPTFSTASNHSHVTINVHSTRAQRRPHQQVFESILALQSDFADIVTDNDQLRADNTALLQHVILLRSKLESAILGQLAVDVAQEALRVTDISAMLARAAQAQAHLHVPLNALTVHSPTSPPLPVTQTHAAAPASYCDTPAYTLLQQQQHAHAARGIPSATPLSSMSASNRALHPSSTQQLSSTHASAPTPGTTRSIAQQNSTPSPALVTAFFAQQAEQERAAQIMQQQQPTPDAHSHAQQAPLNSAMHKHHHQHQQQQPPQQQQARGPGVVSPAGSSKPHHPRSHHNSHPKPIQTGSENTPAQNENLRPSPRGPGPQQLTRKSSGGGRSPQPSHGSGSYQHPQHPSVSPQHSTQPHGAAAAPSPQSSPPAHPSPAHSPPSSGGGRPHTAGQRRHSQQHAHSHTHGHAAGTPSSASGHHKSASMGQAQKSQTPSNSSSSSFNSSGGAQTNATAASSGKITSKPGSAPAAPSSDLDALAMKCIEGIRS